MADLPNGGGQLVAIITINVAAKSIASQMLLVSPDGMFVRIIQPQDAVRWGTVGRGSVAVSAGATTITHVYRAVIVPRLVDDCIVEHHLPMAGVARTFPPMVLRGKSVTVRAR